MLNDIDSNFHNGSILFRIYSWIVIRLQKSHSFVPILFVFLFLFIFVVAPFYIGDDLSSNQLNLIVCYANRFAHWSTLKSEKRHWRISIMNYMQKLNERNEKCNQQANQNIHIPFTQHTKRTQQIFFFFTCYLIYLLCVFCFIFSLCLLHFTTFVSIPFSI